MSHDLTDRECAVLKLAAEGNSNVEIGLALAISPHTVASHFRNIFSKLDVPSRAAAVSWFERNGRPGWEAPDEPPDGPGE